MTIAFLDEQMTGRRQVRTHTAPVAGHRGSTTRLHSGSTSARAAVRPLWPSVHAGTTAALVSTTAAANESQVHELPSRRMPSRQSQSRHMPSPELRLTRRGRLVFGGLLVVVALVVFSLGRFTAGADASAPPLRVTVSSGDTLWSIAEQAAPSADPRDVVDRIVSTNHLSSSSLVPGSVLLVPRG